MEVFRDVDIADKSDAIQQFTCNLGVNRKNLAFRMLQKFHFIL